MTETLLKLLLYSTLIGVCLGLAFRLYAPEVDFTVQLATLFLFIGAITSLVLVALFGLWRK
jgi:hypothetical protein